MTLEPDDAQWLVDDHAISLARLSELSGLSEAELQELVDCGAIVPVDTAAPQRYFHARCIITVRTAGRLRDELELDSHSLALALTFIDRIRELEAQVRALRAQLPRPYR